jgi:hypothetical protein
VVDRLGRGLAVDHETSKTLRVVWCCLMGARSERQDEPPQNHTSQTFGISITKKTPMLPCNITSQISISHISPDVTPESGDFCDHIAALQNS